MSNTSGLATILHPTAIKHVLSLEGKAEINDPNQNDEFTVEGEGRLTREAGRMEEQKMLLWADK